MTRKRDEEAALEALEQFGEVLYPRDAEEPVLAPGPRAALFEWMTEIRKASDLAEVGIRPRRTALLYGPPGTGKTTFAHHFAARLGLPLACIGSENLIDSHLGGTGKNIARLFDALAATEGRVVVLFDEVDAVGSRRMSDQGASVERANSLNVMLRRIEAFEGVALAATNREDILDPALWRRFGMQISIDLPGSDQRFAILRRYLAPFRVSDEENDTLTELTAGASPALLRALMEGVKRALVLGTRTGRAGDGAAGVFAAAVAAVAPPPEIDPVPPLWRDVKALERLRGFAWPPEREESAA